MEGARKLTLLSLLVVAGCHRGHEAPLPTFAEVPSPYVPGDGSTNAYDTYVLAAGATEAAVQGLGKDLLHRTAFQPAQRSRIVTALGPTLSRLGSVHVPCDFRYVPAALGTPEKDRAAWRLIGRSLRWRIDDSLARGDLQGAVANFRIAARFGNDLCGGNPADRTLGSDIVEEARLAILPALPKLDLAGLRALADAGKTGLQRRPGLDKCLENADADMKIALQTLTQAIGTGKFTVLETIVGKDFRDLEPTLKQLKESGAAEFLSDLDQDRRRLNDAWKAAAAHPASERGELLDVKLKGSRPRRTFARHFFLIGRPLLAIEDRSVTRQRLLILEAELRRTAKLSGKAPVDLSKVSKPWSTDPYSGRTFGYLPDGAEFRVYSVGPDLKDDLGDTDESGLSPDIRTVIPR